MSKKFFVSLPYVYPVCPFSVNHTKMFVVADILARWKRSRGYDVCFPIAFHYSGNTAQKIVLSLHGSNKNDVDQVRSLYRDLYRCPPWLINKFSDAISILDYFSQKILSELKSLDISCNYEDYYTTNSEDFSNFVREVICFYDKKGVLMTNKDNKLALKYDDKQWGNEVKKQIGKTFFLKASCKQIIYSSLKNVRSDWSMDKGGGLGVKYKKDILIDPMFDSELFPIFDLYMKFRSKNTKLDRGKRPYFKELLHCLSTGENRLNDASIKHVLEWLPVDMLVGEEHLKNWIAKRFFSENLVLHPKYHTKSYFLLGMGLLDGKRMSASKGHAILTQDLVREYGSVATRLIILLTGGHPSKNYNYVRDLPKQAKKIIDNFTDYYHYLLGILERKALDVKNSSTITKEIELSVTENLKRGYYRQVIIDLMIKVPSELRYINFSEAVEVKRFLDKYLKIMLPSMVPEYEDR